MIYIVAVLLLSLHCYTFLKDTYQYFPLLANFNKELSILLNDNIIIDALKIMMMIDVRKIVVMIYVKDNDDED